MLASSPRDGGSHEAIHPGPRHRVVVPAPEGGAPGLGRRPGRDDRGRDEPWRREQAGLPLPGTDSKAAVDLLDERFPDQAGDTVTIVVHDDDGVTCPTCLGRRPARSSTGSRDLPHVVGRDRRRGTPAVSAQVSADGTTGYAVVQLDSTSARFPVDVATEMIDLAADARRRRHAGRAGRPGDRQRPVRRASAPRDPGLLVAAIVLLVAFGSLVAMGLPLATALFGVGVGLAVGAAAAPTSSTCPTGPARWRR